MTNKTKYTAIAAAITIIVGGAAFYGGMQYEKKQAGSQRIMRSGGGLASGDRRLRQPGQGMVPGGASRGEGGEFISGEVISKDDKSVTIKTRDGGSKIVYFSEGTQIAKSEQGTASDISNGQQVMINGKSGTDGTFTAQNIQIRPAQ